MEFHISSIQWKHLHVECRLDQEHRNTILTNIRVHLFPLGFHRIASLFLSVYVYVFSLYFMSVCTEHFYSSILLAASIWLDYSKQIEH